MRKYTLLTTIVFFCFVCIFSCIKEPQPVKVTGVLVNPTSLSLVEGETGVLVATVSPKDADNQTVIWLSEDGSIATVNNGKVTALKAGSTMITAKSDDGGFTAFCSVTVAPKTIEVTSISLSKTELTLTEGDSETITATVKPDNATDKTVTWSSSNTAVAIVEEGNVTAVKEGTAIITAKAREITSSCDVTVNKKDTCQINGQSYVDMGDGLKWATCNVGANSPEEYGNYYAWGEVVQKTDFSESKYDYKKEFEDAASVNWGATWRLPTEEEWAWLLENCDWTWTEENGVNGYKVTSEVTSNSIFLPAAGFFDDEALAFVGRNGLYWSSSPKGTENYYKKYVHFHDEKAFLSDGNRFNGLSVRPVSE